MTPLRSRRLPQLTSKPSCAYSPLGVDAASTVWWARRFAVCRWDAGASALVVPGGAGRRYELAVTDGAGRRCELAAPGRQSPRWHSLQLTTGAGAMPVPGRAHWGMRERCTFLGRFAPRAPISPGRSFLKVQICPNQCTHPAYAPHAPRPRPTHTSPTPHTHPAHAPSSDAQPYKKPADLPPPPLFPQVTLPQNTQSADFLYPPHQKQAPTEQSAPVPPTA